MTHGKMIDIIVGAGLCANVVELRLLIVIPRLDRGIHLFLLFNTKSGFPPSRE
jgi:hypothetical protein